MKRKREPRIKKIPLVTLYHRAIYTRRNSRKLRTFLPYLTYQKTSVSIYLYIHDTSVCISRVYSDNTSSSRARSRVCPNIYIIYPALLPAHSQAPNFPNLSLSLSLIFSALRVHIHYHICLPTIKRRTRARAAHVCSGEYVPRGEHNSHQRVHRVAVGILYVCVCVCVD